ncbi:hypothetical protein PLICRDRAFT_147661 [Plicaturopsis crispa FD-325 SS-3]|uniref:Uncharacterized protein n=1 Tax=Plicaturopsis crispa FD-325 SS-3 TaxID=944288 RepID=A0A0C9SWV2_PLICR|nr:hypothetical protein PLICRDRAFT_147661 [Plicaturopsis crispa FD-325 SS-3]
MPPYAYPMTVDDDDDDDDTPELTHAGVKRRIAELEDDLERARHGAVKARSEAAVHKNMGRAMRRVVSFFDSPRNLVAEDDRRARIEGGLEDADDDEGFDHLSYDRLHRGFKALTKFIPVVNDKLNDDEFTSEKLHDFYKHITAGGNAARGDDAGKLKTSVVGWIAELFCVPVPPIDHDSKLERGLDHDATGALLCPAEFDWTYESVRTKIRNAHPDFLVTADRWPSFLYEKISEIDPENLDQGLFKGKMMLKGFTSIYNCPSSAREIVADDDVGNPEQINEDEPPKKKRKKEKTTTRSSVAVLIGLDAVTPRALAYTAVQVRFALSNVGSWRDSDGDFDYVDFYNNIVDYFEVPAGPVTAAANQDLLDWWTMRVLKPVNARRRPGQARNHASASVSKLAAQRAAKELVAVARAGAVAE